MRGATPVFVGNANQRYPQPDIRASAQPRTSTWRPDERRRTVREVPPAQPSVQPVFVGATRSEAPRPTFVTPARPPAQPVFVGATRSEMPRPVFVAPAPTRVYDARPVFVAPTYSERPPVVLSARNSECDDCVTVTAIGLVSLAVVSALFSKLFFLRY